MAETNGNGAGWAPWFYQLTVVGLLGFVFGLFTGTSSLSPLGARVTKLEQDVTSLYLRLGRYADRIRDLELEVARHHPAVEFRTPLREQHGRASEVGE